MSPDVKELNDASLGAAMEGEDRLVIVEFYTSTCPSCRAIEPVYGQLSDELGKDALFTKLNAETSPLAARKYGVMGVPTFKFFCRGKPIGEIVGAVNATMLRNTVKDHIRHRAECAKKTTWIGMEMDGYG